MGNSLSAAEREAAETERETLLGGNGSAAMAEAGVTVHPEPLTPAIMMRPKEEAESWYAMYKPDHDNVSKIGPDGRFTEGKDSDECVNCLIPCFFRVAHMAKLFRGRPTGRTPASAVALAR